MFTEYDTARSRPETHRVAMLAECISSPTLKKMHLQKAMASKDFMFIFA